MTRVRSRPPLAVRLGIEPLEARTVLSTTPIVQGPISPEPRIPPLVPIVSLAQTPLLVVVTPNKAVYHVGEAVKVTITEFNTSDHAARVLTGCQILNASVTR